MSDNILEVQARADFSALFGEADAAASSVESASKRITAAMNTAGSAPEKLTFSTMEARHAMMGLGEEVGVKMPRFVSSFISHLDGVGPALASAFSVVAVIGLVEVLARVPEAIDKIVSKFSGWDEAAKGAYAAQLALNKQIIEAGRALALETLANDEAGMKGAQRTQKELTDIDLKIAKLRQYRAEEIAGAAAAQKELDATIKSKSLPGPKMVDYQTETRAIAEGSDEWKAKRKAIDDAATAVARYDAEIAKLQQVETPRKTLTLGTEQQADADRARQEEERKDKQATADMMSAYDYELKQRGISLKAELTAEGEAIRANLKAIESIDKEAAKSAEELARLKEKSFEEVARAQEKANREQEQLFKKLEKPWDDLEKSMQRTMTRTAMGIIEGSLSIKQAFTKLGEGILETTVNALAKVVAQHAAAAIMTNVIEKSQMAASIAAFLGYQSTKLAAGKTAAVAEGTTDAGLAGAAAFASVIEALPFPFNMAVAPGVAAEAVTATLALASFDAGTMRVPSTGLAMLHAGEAVIPAGPAERFRDGGFGGHTFNQNLTINGNADADMFKKSGRQIVAMATRELRRMNR